MNQNQLDRLKASVTKLRDVCNEIVELTNQVSIHSQFETQQSEKPMFDILALIKDKDVMKSFVSMIGGIIREVKKEIDAKPSDNSNSDENEARLHAELMKVSVEQLDLSLRALNSLRTHGIKTIGDLMKFSESDLIKYRGFGNKSIAEIESTLREIGLELKK